MKILIANRGEIACRIIRTCKLLGHEAITLYTDEEKDYPQVWKAHQSVSLGSGPLAETYLNVKKILSIASEYGAQAIHPGYGFLSENAQFAKSVKDANLIFIGPSPESIELMGDKIASKEYVKKIGVPIIPGLSVEEKISPGQLKRRAQEVGLPLLIKASAGGGGKGMRIVRQWDEFESALELAQSEARKSFGDDRVLLEKWITSPRHIEVQILADHFGRTLHLQERECSIQRRYQKIIEECPSPGLMGKPEVRDKIHQAAQKLAASINYQGAGTIEFIYDDSDDQFYFLEMNTRLQVEHPVTEMVTGLDLVEWQIRVAMEEKLPFSQEDVNRGVRGHAIEARVYSEMPAENFRPSIGQLYNLSIPQDPSIRFDNSIVGGNEVSVNFDPMIGKMTAWGGNRAMAIERLDKGLGQLLMDGLETNKEYLCYILRHPSFISGQTLTHFIENYHQEILDQMEQQSLPLAPELLIGLHLLGLDEKGPQKAHEPTKLTRDAWTQLKDFRL